MEHPLHCDQTELLVEYREDTSDDGHRHTDSLVTVTLVKQETGARDSSDWLDQSEVSRGNRTDREIKQEQSSDWEYLATTSCVKTENEQIPAIPVASLQNQEKQLPEPIKLESNPWDDAPCKLACKDRGFKQEDPHFDLCQTDNQGPIGAPYPVVLYQSGTSSKLIEEKEKMECGKLDRLLNDQVIVSAVANIARSPEHTTNQIPTSDKQYRCVVCDYRCAQLSDFFRHSRNHADVSYRCQLDYQEFLNKPRHIDETPFKCSQCDYSAALKSTLSQHMRTHDERPYKCSQCDYSAAVKSILSQHMRTHTGEKPYKCPQCDYSGATKGYLSQHMRKHTGEKSYKCPWCDYSAAVKSTLCQHMGTHTGERPYKCSWCDYSAVVKSSPTIHMRTHTGEKPYKCSQCNYSSATKANLSQHMRKHTG